MIHLFHLFPLSPLSHLQKGPYFLYSSRGKGGGEGRKKYFKKIIGGRGRERWKGGEERGDKVGKRERFLMFDLGVGGEIYLFIFIYLFKSVYVCVKTNQIFIHSSFCSFFQRSCDKNFHLSLWHHLKRGEKERKREEQKTELNK